MEEVQINVTIGSSTIKGTAKAELMLYEGQGGVQSPPTSVAFLGLVRTGDVFFVRAEDDEPAGSDNGLLDLPHPSCWVWLSAGDDYKVYVSEDASTYLGCWVETWEGRSHPTKKELVLRFEGRRGEPGWGPCLAGKDAIEEYQFGNRHPDNTEGRPLLPPSHYLPEIVLRIRGTSDNSPELRNSLMSPDNQRSSSGAREENEPNHPKKRVKIALSPPQIKRWRVPKAWRKPTPFPDSIGMEGDDAYSIEDVEENRTHSSGEDEDAERKPSDENEKDHKTWDQFETRLRNGVVINEEHYPNALVDYMDESEEEPDNEQTVKCLLSVRILLNLSVQGIDMHKSDHVDECFGDTNDGEVGLIDSSKHTNREDARSEGGTSQLESPSAGKKAHGRSVLSFPFVFGSYDAMIEGAERFDVFAEVPAEDIVMGLTIPGFEGIIALEKEDYEAAAWEVVFQE